MSILAGNALKLGSTLLSTTVVVNGTLAVVLSDKGLLEARSLHTTTSASITRFDSQNKAVPTHRIRVAQMPVTASTVTTDTQPPSTIGQIGQYGKPALLDKALAQITSVSQLSDVQPTDWAFQALQSLVERYGCIAGYPDSTYRGNRVLTRYEFAAGLNACLDRVNELIATATTEEFDKEDLATLQKLQSEFTAELATLRGRVDALETSTAELEANQFSTTTQLRGEAIFFLGGVFGNEAAEDDGDLGNNPGLDENIVLGDRVRLAFDTSFIGKDRLRVRLQARNIMPFDDDVTGTRMTRLSFDGDNENDVEVDYIYYRFPAGEQTTVTLSAVNAEFSDLIYTLNPLLEASGNGSISRFGRYSPIYRGFGAGATVAHEFNDNFNLTLGYLASDNASSEAGNGAFNGNYSALAQLVYRPKKDIDIGLVYAHSYFSETSESGVNMTFSNGSANAIAPFGEVSTSTNSVQLGTSIQLSPQIVLSGWAEFTFASAKVSDNNADIFNFAVNLALPNLGKEGSLGAIIFGLPPKVISNSINANEDEDTSFHIEALYRYQLTDNITITPGVIVITNPEHNENNDNIYVGAIRTTFNF